MTRTTARTARTRLAHTFAIAPVCLLFALPVAAAPAGDAAPFADARAVADALWSKVQAWAMKATTRGTWTDPGGSSLPTAGVSAEPSEVRVVKLEERSELTAPRAQRSAASFKLGGAADPKG